MVKRPLTNTEKTYRRFHKSNQLRYSVYHFCPTNGYKNLALACTKAGVKMVLENVTSRSSGFPEHFIIYINDAEIQQQVDMQVFSCYQTKAGHWIPQPKY